MECSLKGSGTLTFYLYEVNLEGYKVATEGQACLLKSIIQIKLYYYKGKKKRVFRKISNFLAL